MLKSKKPINAPMPEPIGKPEITDGTNWFTLATENWVLNSIGKIAACLVATKANLTATYDNGTNGVGASLTNSGTQSALVIDGIALSNNDRVLVKDQDSALENGIYVVSNIGSLTTSWVLTRSTDFDTNSQMLRGNVVDIISGTNNGVTAWMLTSITNIIGTDAITFARLSKSGVDSVLGTANQIVVTIDNNVATIGLSANPILPGNASVTIPTGTTAERPASPSAGMFRFNTSL